ncbi:hypothetical protein OMAG_002616 [Candidatus Omnitrophus magneticus]|uniref:TIGR04255 family protein n=1 Tax=Candidatus Omnitrophus magneticus TaxID=1609969 RepID=A0A0F0CNE1_9BACT|nr:hypothetical protein OMAG_002616 [Candidatus Omnitrophus magneticus]
MKPYNNPPITEAILDIKTTLPPDIFLSHLQEFQEFVKSDYPVKKERRSFEGGVQFKSGSAPEFKASPEKVDGFLFHADDGKSIVQVRLDGFTFNKLRPYSNWEKFNTEAKRLWTQYVKIAKPISVSRIALRYINRIELPMPFSDFKEYILTAPEVATGIPQGLAGFFVRLAIPNEDIGATAIVIETIEAIKPDTNKLPLIFDLDVFKSASMPPDTDKIWAILNQLREYKNQIFDKSLTEKTKELFK